MRYPMLNILGNLSPYLDIANISKVSHGFTETNSQGIIVVGEVRQFSRELFNV
jgi:hypothetical protein